MGGKPTFAAGAREVREPMSVMRKKIAEHMIESRRTSAHVHSVFEVDLTRVVQLRDKHKLRVRVCGVEVDAERKKDKAPGSVFRLPIDRVFTIQGAGAVVTGSLVGGALERGSELELLPFLSVDFVAVGGQGLAEVARPTVAADEVAQGRAAHGHRFAEHRADRLGGRRGRP